MNAEKESHINALEKETNEGFVFKELDVTDREGRDMIERLTVRSEKEGVNPEKTRVILENASQRLTQLRNAAMFMMLAHASDVYGEQGDTRKVETDTHAEMLRENPPPTLPEVLPAQSSEVSKMSEAVPSDSVEELPEEITELTTPEAMAVSDAILEAAEIKLKDEKIDDKTQPQGSPKTEDTAETKVKAGIEMVSMIPGAVKKFPIIGLIDAVLDIKKDLSENKPASEIAGRLFRSILDAKSLGLTSVAWEMMSRKEKEPKPEPQAEETTLGEARQN